MELNQSLGTVPDLVRGVERYQQNAVGLTSMHSFGSGTKLLDRRETLSYSGIVHGETCQAAVGLLTNQWLAAAQLDFLPVDERVTIMWLGNAERKTITVVCACTLMSCCEATMAGKASRTAAQVTQKSHSYINYTPEFDTRELNTTEAESLFY